MYACVHKHTFWLIDSKMQSDQRRLIQALHKCDRLISTVASCRRIAHTLTEQTGSYGHT